ncbi:hypothetical protein Riv7116_4449 [Rivularia sp. PCC 7116]|uniref:hypothetical protein n=1 Tax=Rivularia sp. PCC 7116 TaxID=373994 RepID=UPI00029F07B5|nr:hypothetical protein [Rivularia sp. PCC 7116]AFY56870.1 hypothetical protein Riv7116_4449 [Rivularia sp. PCC 7116]
MEAITASAIATLAFTKAFEKSIEKFTEATWNKIDSLRKKIWLKFGNNQAAQNALTAADKGSGQDLDLVAQYLEKEMEWDTSFAQEVQNLAREIQQEINIGEMQGENVLIVNSGEGNQYNNKDNKAPIFQGVKDSPITINYNNPNS